ncbi:AcrR family transcriptional regulator [Geomicrobium halophilum]|uniref:AcrR family transcriptional regulator n=1 Tax=Geomicrobium halophilum TaxID=549000 RepID=A0A841Q0W8_9BACL|nr:TetR/AcrR family transcriptional regulator [Geomicrobium halophilum]MBB6451085.1 AcrR family transcriptional regulator [Geomicrobium halophilum]
MKARDKKEIIFKSAVKVLAKQGVNHFSIQNICKEAGISKGGFIYHFSSKDDMLKELHEYLIEIFRGLIENERKKRDSYTQAYIYACLAASKREESTAFASLNNYKNQQEIVAAWEPFNTEVYNNLSKELPKDWVTLIGITTDGLWKNGEFYSEEELTSVQYLLLDIIKKFK